MNPDSYSDEIIEASEYLEKEDGFKDKQLPDEHLISTSLLVAVVFGRNTEMMDNPVITGTLSIFADKTKAHSPPHL